MIVVYLLKNFLFNILLFFKDWYWDSFFVVYGKVLFSIRRVESRLALRANLHFLFSPLYQEYNIIGYGLGFLFRGVRIATGVGMYVIVAVVGVIVYAVWAGIPLFVLFNVINSIV